jgi:hypothetical protein
VPIPCPNPRSRPSPPGATSLLATGARAAAASLASLSATGAEREGERKRRGGRSGGEAAACADGLHPAYELRNAVHVPARGRSGAPRELEHLPHQRRELAERPDAAVPALLHEQEQRLYAPMQAGVPERGEVVRRRQL